MNNPAPARTGATVDLHALPATWRQTWCDLVLQAADASPFLGPTFAEGVAAASGSRIAACFIEETGQPIAVFPFQVSSRMHRLFAAGERVGGEFSDRAGLAARPGVRIDDQELLRLAGLHAFLFSHLGDGDRARGLAGEQPETGLVIDFPDGAEAFWADRRQRDIRFIRDTERRRRRLESDLGPLSCQLNAREPAVLDQLIAAKRAQYRRTGFGDPFAIPWAAALLHALAGRREPDCTGILSTLHAGGTWVASHFGLRCRDTLHYWFPVYNPDLARYAPGRLLLSAIIDRAEDLGIRRIDRGEGDTPAKRDFATGEQQFWRGLWMRPGLRAACFRAGQAIGWRLARWNRRSPATSASASAA